VKQRANSIYMRSLFHSSKFISFQTVKNPISQVHLGSIALSILCRMTFCGQSWFCPRIETMQQLPFFHHSTFLLTPYCSTDFVELLVSGIRIDLVVRPRGHTYLITEMCAHPFCVCFITVGANHNNTHTPSHHHQQRFSSIGLCV